MKNGRHTYASQCTIYAEQCVKRRISSMKKIVSATLKSLILIAEIVCPYILAYVYEMQNQRYREMLFYPENNAYYMMIIMTILLPLGFLILDIIAARLIYEKGLWKLAIFAIGVFNLAIIPITFTGNVPISLYFKMVPLYSGGKLMMFILNNFILIWLALAAVIKSRSAAIDKLQDQGKEEGEV